MKRLHFQVANNLSLLHDELQMALPDCRPVPNLDGRIDPFTGAVELEAVMTVEAVENDIWLSVPDNANEYAISAVVQAHNPAGTQPDPRRERLDRIAEINLIPRSQWTTAQIRELLELTAQEVST